MPRVSVVTGYYNRAEVLERTIESILGQTYTDFELLVFDDHSSDDTASCLRDLAKRYNDPRFRYIIHETNTGFVRGLRRAIAETTGDYVAIQGSGDVSLPERLEKQVSLLDSRSEVGVVGSWYYNVEEDSGIRRLNKPLADTLRFEDFLSRNVFTHGEVMIRRSVYDYVGGYRTAFKHAQDRDLWLRIAKVARFATVPQALYERFGQTDGVSYVPASVVSQASYSRAAVKLATLPEYQEAEAISLLESGGLSDIVPLDDIFVQNKVMLVARRMVWGGLPDVATGLARTYVTDRRKRAALIVLGRLFGSTIGRVLLPIVHMAFALRRAFRAGLKRARGGA